MAGSLEAQRQELRELAEAPGVEPAFLEGRAWEVIVDATYPQSPEAIELLPDTFNLLGRLANDGGLRAEGSEYYLNARLALATQEAIRTYALREAASPKTRIQSRRNLGRFILDTLGDDLDFRRSRPAIQQKMAEALLLDFLLGSPASSQVFGFSAPPFMHNFQGVESNTGTTAFQVSAVAAKARKLVPISVSMFHPAYMDEPERNVGVLLVSLGEHLMSHARAVPSILEASKLQGDIHQGQEWMIYRMAGIVIDEMVRGYAGLNSHDKTWIINVKSHLVDRVLGFDPSIPSKLPPLFRRR